MGLLKCFECGTMVSEYAEKCPACGCPISAIKEHINLNGSMETKGICRYQGVKYDLSEVETLLNDNKFMLATRVIHDKLGLEPLKASLFVKFIQFNHNQIPADYDEAIKQYHDHNEEEREKNAIHCKYCGSTNVEKIEYLPLPWASFQEYWYCNNCHSRFDI